MAAKWKIIPVMAFSVGTAVPGFAAVLPPGGSVSLSGTSASSDPTLAGTILAETTTTFPALAQVGNNQYEGQLFTAELRSTVVRETAAGTLDFYYQVINNSDFAVDPVRDVTIPGFTELTVDAGYRTDEGGLYQANTASRDASGDAINFDFVPTPNAFVAGEETTPVLVRTNARDFSSNGLVTINFNGIEGIGAPPVPAQGIVSTYAPLGVPEPSSFALFSIVAICLCRRSGLRRRERNGENETEVG